MFAISKGKLKKMVLSLCLAVGCVSPVMAAQDFLPVSEVQEGMHGYAKTVVHGTKIDTFNVDVLGIMKHKGATGGDLVLVKVSGPLIDETNGIAQGMSGSPVYINGKLLGAIAYGFPQSNGRIGMVTPISDMLRLWTIDNTKSEAGGTVDNKDLIPLSTPLMASGYTPAGMEFLADKMKDFHMVPYAAVSNGSDEIPRPLEAGGSVSATLVTGDLKLGAIGTVTYVDGDHMVAFGHPFMDKGSSSYFMHNSYIFTVVPSHNIPFKLGSVGAEIGEVNEDRGTGISGLSGKIPESVRLHSTVTDEDTGHVGNLNVRMIRNEQMLPMLSVTSVYNNMSNVLDRSGKGTVSFSYTLFPEDMKKKPFTRTNMYWSSKDIAERSVDEMYNVIRILEQNRFEPYTLRDISVDMKVTGERKTAQLLDAAASPTVVSPGDTIYVRARLAPYRGDVFYKDLAFTVPKDQPYGDMILEVRGGAVVPLPYLIQQQKFNLTDEILQRLRTYKDFDDLFDKLEKEDKNNQVVVEILDPNVSMIAKDEDNGVKAEIQDKRPSNSPDYLKDKSKSEKAGDKEEDTPKSSVDTDYVVYGDGQFTFKVMAPADRDRALKKLAKTNKQLMAEMKNEGKESISGGQGKKDDGTGKKDENKPDNKKTADVVYSSSYYTL